MTTSHTEIWLQYGHASLDAWFHAAASRPVAEDMDERQRLWSFVRQQFAAAAPDSLPALLQQYEALWLNGQMTMEEYRDYLLARLREEGETV